MKLSPILFVTLFISSSLLYGCASNKSNLENNTPEKEASSFLSFFSKEKNWQEIPPESFPKLPNSKNLINFSVPSTPSIHYAIDPTSISIGKDQVVRYTIVITSSQNAQTVLYEGMRCDTQQVRLYATLDADQNHWEAFPNSSWGKIIGSIGNYQAELQENYLCSDKAPIHPTQKIIERIKYPFRNQ